MSRVIAGEKLIFHFQYITFIPLQPRHRDICTRYTHSNIVIQIIFFLHPIKTAERPQNPYTPMNLHQNKLEYVVIYTNLLDFFFFFCLMILIQKFIFLIFKIELTNCSGLVGGKSILSYGLTIIS